MYKFACSECTVHVQDDYLSILIAAAGFLDLVSLLKEVSRGGHSNRSCTCTRDRGQNFGQVAKVENLNSQRVKVNSAGQNGQNRSKGRLQVGVA